MGNNENVVNISKLIHENAKLMKGLKETKFNVSPGAISEYSGRVKDHIEAYAPELCKIADKHGRKTIFDEDVIELFSRMEVAVVD